MLKGRLKIQHVVQRTSNRWQLWVAVRIRKESMKETVEYRVKIMVIVDKIWSEKSREYTNTAKERYCGNMKESHDP